MAAPIHRTHTASWKKVSSTCFYRWLVFAVVFELHFLMFLETRYAPSVTTDPPPQLPNNVFRKEAQKTMKAESSAEGPTPKKTQKNGNNHLLANDPTTKDFNNTVERMMPIESSALQHSEIGAKTMLPTFRECTSPERNVPWPLPGDVPSKTSTLTCGLSGDSEFTNFLKEKTLPLLREYQEECQELVVYGVAFGSSHFANIAKHAQFLDSKNLIRKHGHCFFMFVLEAQMPASSTISHIRLIPVPSTILPYESLRRNKKRSKSY